MNVVTGLDALQLVKFDRKNVCSPIFDSGNSRQFLKFVRDGQILEFARIQIDGLQRSQDISLAANVIEGRIQIGDVVLISFVDLARFRGNFFLWLRVSGTGLKRSLIYSSPPGFKIVQQTSSRYFLARECPKDSRK